MLIKDVQQYNQRPVGVGLLCYNFLSSVSVREVKRMKRLLVPVPVPVTNIPTELNDDSVKSTTTVSINTIARTRIRYAA